MNSTYTTYLPLNKFHIVPLDSLEPSSIKRAAKKTFHDREKIGHTTKLNAIAKQLGCEGGFANYERFFAESIKPFLKIHGLKKRVNLFKHQYKGPYHEFKEFSPQQVSERLFYSGRSLPEKIFTGHNFDFESVMGWHSMDVESIVEQLKDTSFVQQVFKHYYEPLTAIDIIEAHAFDPIEFIIEGKMITCPFIDLIILAHCLFSSSSSYYHLLSDLLTSDFSGGIVHCIYLSSYATEEEKNNYKLNRERETKFIKLFRKRIAQFTNGWVTTHRLNRNIIFICDAHGNYDFVIKNQRNRVFDHQIYGDNLKRSDIPSCIEDYRFKRWHYFEYQGWREQDDHKSEEHYYELGNTPANYPGVDVVLQQYLIDKGEYSPLKKTYGNRVTGFKKVKLSTKTLMVSELITIEDLSHFMAHNSDYMEYRQGDLLQPVNSDTDQQRPASMTFYDVLAYLNWREKEEHVPFRLLTTEEYLELTDHQPQVRIPLTRNSDLQFYSLKNEPYSNHPPYMADEDFQRLQLHFKNDPEYIKHHKLSFVNSDFFCEWLFEGCQIRSKSHLSFYKNHNIKRAAGPRDSTGKYKGVKTGFRICYEYTSQ